MINILKVTKFLPSKIKFHYVDPLQLRNIGISAHIDSGKTTFTQRVLYYAGKIQSIHQVKGSDRVGATMDFMDLQRQKGITIQSAATHLKWNNHFVNLIDTPGHVDFTIQVQRALKVLDGAILIICGVAGVQPQTITVNRQMDRYRIIFINKLDRMGGNAQIAVRSIKQKIKLNCALIHIPIGQDQSFKGIIDLIQMKAYYFQGQNGQQVKQEPVPQNQLQKAIRMRMQMIGALANIDSEIEQYYLEQKEISSEIIKNAIRRNCLSLKFYPVFIGSAFKNKGVQLTLNGVCDYLPNPTEKVNKGYKKKAQGTQEQVQLLPKINKQFIGYAFKLEQNRFGQLTYVRVYQGKIKKGDIIFSRSKKIKVSRIVKMHANNMEDINDVGPGDIFAIFGGQCSTGDTLTQITGQQQIKCSSMFVPEAVMSVSAIPLKSEYLQKFQKAISRFQRQDPTFRVNVDKQSEQIILSGMGQLHIEIYLERMKREYKIEVKTGPPTVSFRQTITKKVRFDYLHKKQTGGAGQFARVIGYIQPVNSSKIQYRNKFESKLVGLAIPPQYANAIQKAFYQAVKKGPLTGYPVVNFKYVIEDGQTHIVDSSATAFGIATKYSFLQAFKKANPVILEPIMQVEVTVASNIYQSVMAGLNKRKALMTNTQSKGNYFCMTCEIPLREMFGYSNELRGLTSGQGEFVMQYKKHEEMNPVDAKQAMQKFKKKKAG